MAPNNQNQQPQAVAQTITEDTTVPLKLVGAMFAAIVAGAGVAVGVYVEVVRLKDNQGRMELAQQRFEAKLQTISDDVQEIRARLPPRTRDGVPTRGQ